MDAPLYPPAAAYEAPAQVPEPMTTRDCSFAQFLANPQASAILFAEAPAFRMMIGTSMIKPHLGNMSPGSMVQFGAATPEQLDRIDAKLKAANLMTGTGQ
ncbi:MAG: hypothetical protein KGN34_08795 [Sphingomonadales bacterium]|nr:hypothetical protein [Sphingomonadales bacterium]